MKALRHRAAWILAISTLILLAVSAAASQQGAASVAAASDPCTTANVLSGSNFEIDTNANLKVDGASPCIDWLAGGTGSALRSGVLAKNDKPTGSGDDSFGKGTSEDEANPTIVTGSIPPNKSDLKVFGVFTETAPSTGKFLELFWSRVQNPSGTTNMDFELNQRFCDPTATPTNCANNGLSVTPETPVRTAGDKLITYDLAKGGTVPTISIRTWTGSAWGPATELTGMGEALASVNTSTISAADSNGVGPLDPFTFGEAAISFAALFPSGACGSFGSAYLKSRSSDSFSAELKDFVAPERVRISNCATTLTTSATSSVTLGSPISDTATLSGASATATGTITFHLFFNDNTCSAASEVNTGLSPVSVQGSGSYNSGNFTPTAAGSYYWTASYSGDANNSAASTACGDAGEVSVVNKKQPSISTALSATSITVGQSVTDSATLTGATSNAGGTVTYSVYTDANCTNLFANAGTKTVTNGVVPASDSLTFNSAGTFYWQASYSGDQNNNPAISSCTSEQLIVKAKPSISTTLSSNSITVGQSIHDSATLSGATSDAGGTVTYTVYADNQCTQGARNGGTKTVVNGVVPDSDSLTFNSAGTFYWQASYSGDAHNTPAISSCTSEQLIVKAQPSIATTLSASLIGIGQSVSDSATLAGATSDASGTVTYAVYTDANCTNVFASAGTKTVTNGVVPASNSVTFNSAGTFYWQASYSGDAHNTPAISSCTTEQLTVIGPCVLGYPSGRPPALSSVIFNESEVLRTFAAVPGGGSVAGPNDKIAVWYNDEHAITLGVRRVLVKTSSGTTTTNYAITSMTKNPDSASNPLVGTTALTGDQAGTDLATWNSTYGFLDHGRPMWPALFITDITGDPNNRSGDWQQGGSAAIPPNDIFGTWKGAVRTVDKTKTPTGITVTPDADPAKNNWNGVPDTPPGGFAILKQEGYGAEVRWNVSGLGLLTGHAYRLQFMVHDGDQNKTGGDSGEACMNVIIPG